MKVLICLTLVALLCCTVEGKKSKKGPKTKKQEKEPCSLEDIPWGKCYKAVNCPSSPSLNCAGGLRCCRPPKEDISEEDTNASEGDTAYDKFLMDMKKYYP
nr:uncharacterized protein LOC131799563 [Pocillopora verrucosa]